MKIFSRILKEDCHQTINYSLLSKGFVRSYKPIQKIIAPPSQTTNEAIQNIKNESYKNSDINTLKIPKIEKVFEKEFKNEKGDSIEGYLGHNEPHVQKRKEKRTQDYDQGENSNFASKRQQDNRPRSTEDPVDSFNKRNNSGERDFRNPRDNKSSEGGFREKRERDNRNDRNFGDRGGERDNRTERNFSDRGGERKMDKSNYRDVRREKDYDAEEREFFPNRNKVDNDNSRGNYKDRERRDSRESQDFSKKSNSSNNFERRGNPRFEGQNSYEKPDYRKGSNNEGNNYTKERSDENYAKGKKYQNERKFNNPDRNVEQSDDETMDLGFAKNMNELKNSRNNKVDFNAKEKKNPISHESRKVIPKTKEVVEKDDESDDFNLESIDDDIIKENNSKRKTPNEKTSNDMKKENIKKPIVNQFETESIKITEEISDVISKTNEEKPDEGKLNLFDYLYGSHSVEAALHNNFRKVQEFYILNSYKLNPSTLVAKFLEIAQTKNIKITYLTKNKLDKYASNRPHNGVIIKCELRQYTPLKKFSEFSEKYKKKTKGNLIILVDQVSDPQNVGSIIRSSFFIGADNVIINKRNIPQLNSTISKVSSGASETMELFSLKQMNTFLQDAKKEGWKIIMTKVERDDREIDSEKKMIEETEEEIITSENNTNSNSENIELNNLMINSDDNIIIVISSEKSVSEILNKTSNYNIIIPPLLDSNFIGKSPFDLINSLNVGVSAGILLNHIKYLQKLGNTEEKKHLNKNI